MESFGGMVKGIEKLRNNILSPNALSVLGTLQYARYLNCVLAQMPRVLRSGDLRFVDKAMSSHARSFNYRRSRFVFDCAFGDQVIDDGTYSFGVVREIYIRDCYFRWHEAGMYLNAATVIDLGANRGAFSVLMAGVAQQVVSVEAQPQFAPVIHHNMVQNGYRNYSLEIGFVGAGGAFEDCQPNNISVAELLARHGLTQVDFMKIDSEGSEFALFASPDWLDSVRAISMEVHQVYGDIQAILDPLAQHGFQVRLADETLQRVTDPSRATFLYAAKNGFGAARNGAQS
jgi:hypothetical protein